MGGEFVEFVGWVERSEPHQNPKETLKEEYDDSPWTREELESVAWETSERAG